MPVKRRTIHHNGGHTRTFLHELVLRPCECEAVYSYQMLSFVLGSSTKQGHWLLSESAQCSSDSHFHWPLLPVVRLDTLPQARRQNSTWWVMVGTTKAEAPRITRAFVPSICSLLPVPSAAQRRHALHHHQW